MAASRQKQRKPSDALTAPQPEEALPAAVPTGAVAVSSSETKLPENDPWEVGRLEINVLAGGTEELLLETGVDTIHGQANPYGRPH